MTRRPLDPQSEPHFLRVSEIFGPTIQGEGAMVGRPTVFVRLGGCDYRCSWCDSLHAVLPQHRKDWKTMMPEVIAERVTELANGPILITLSGGNPALQPCWPLIHAARAQGHTVALETQGSHAAEWFSALDHLCLSPKPPSSGMTTNWGDLDECLLHRPRSTILKVVVFDDLDFAYALAVRDKYPHIPLYLSVGNSDLRLDTERAELNAGLLAAYRWLVTKVGQAKLYDVVVLPQLHVLVWGNARAV